MLKMIFISIDFVMPCVKSFYFLLIIKTCDTYYYVLEREGYAEY